MVRPERAALLMRAALLGKLCLGRTGDSLAEALVLEPEIVAEVA